MGIETKLWPKAMLYQEGDCEVCWHEKADPMPPGEPTEVVHGGAFNSVVCRSWTLCAEHGSELESQDEPCGYLEVRLSLGERSAELRVGANPSLECILSRDNCGCWTVLGGVPASGQYKTLGRRSWRAWAPPSGRPVPVRRRLHSPASKLAAPGKE